MACEAKSGSLDVPHRGENASAGAMRHGNELCESWCEVSFVSTRWTAAGLC